MTFRSDTAAGQDFWRFQSVGDLNSDGFVDWQVWMYREQDTIPFTINTYWGGPQADTIPDLIFHMPVQSWVYPAGDFNGDGFDDLYLTYLIGDSGTLLYGGNPMDTLADWRLHSPPGHAYQASARSFGDVNGDGFSDFVSGTSPSVSMTYVFLGSTVPDTIPAYTWTDFYSSTSVVVRDLNGDSRDELVFASSGGHFNVHLGRDVLSSVPDYILDFDPACYPFSITSVGDFNRDGYNDLVVIDDACNNLWGTLMLYLGHPWLNSEPVVTIEGRNPPLNLIGINNAAGLGDVNGDHVDDFAIGAFNTNFDGFRGRCIIVSGDTTLRAGVGERQPAMPRELSVTVYPNPFNGRTTVRFSLAAAGDVDVRVFDVTGREAMRVLHDRLRAGEQTVEMNASGMASGVYLLVLRANEETFSQKLLLIR
jgi:hypothetical protein